MAVKSQIHIPNPVTGEQEIHHFETELSQIKDMKPFAQNLNNKAENLLIKDYESAHNGADAFIDANNNVTLLLPKIIRCSGFETLCRSTDYAVGDIVYSTKLPSYLRLECVSAGTIGNAEPDYANITAGQYVTDGTAVFIVTDIRDGAQVGDIKLSPILRNGYVKANGAVLTSARANYPRLVTFVTENPSLNAGNDTAWNSNKALYVYNSGADTLRVPDATGRVLQGGSAAGMLGAGLPNITGGINWRSMLVGSTYLPPFRSVTGAFIESDGPSFNTNNLAGNGMSTDGCQLSFNAFRSSSIYGSSTTVQPPALTMIPQIKY